MSETALPLFYRKPVALNAEIHGALTLGASPQGYRFAAGSQTVLLASTEFFDAGRQFPIVFAPAPDQPILPVVLLGLERNENLFVDDRGAWLGQYLPAYIRRYPFITSDGDDGQVRVCIDEAFDGLNREGGAPLFDNGAPSAKMTEIQAYLQDYLLQMRKTEEFCATLVESGLLGRIEAQANLADGRRYTLNGMLVVDEQRLTQLPDTDIVRLFRGGMLGLIHAHLLSLRNLDRLPALKQSRSTSLS